MKQKSNFQKLGGKSYLRAHCEICIAPRLIHKSVGVSAFRNYQLLLLLILTTIPQQKILFIVRKMVSVMEMPWRYRALETIQLQFVVNGTDYHLHSMGTVTSWLSHSSLSIEVLGLDFLVDSAFLPRRIVM